MEEGKKVKGGRRHGSIGTKILVIMAILIIAYIALVEANISALYKIGDSTAVMGDTYLKVVTLEGDATTIVEQIRMYAFQGFARFGDEGSENDSDILYASIDNLEKEINEIADIGSNIDDSTITGSINIYIEDVRSYCSLCKDLAADLAAKDIDTLYVRIGSLDESYAKVKESQDKFGKAVKEAADSLQYHTGVRVDGTRIFNVIMLFVFILIAAVSVFIMIFTVSRPAKASKNLMKDIVEKIDNGEGDLTERIPVKTSDEVGQMAEGINGFLDELQSIMKKLKDQSETLLSVSESVNNEVAVSGDNAGNVSAAMEQMAASMQEISATLGQIATGSDNILKEIDEMNSNVQDGVSLVSDIKQRANEMHGSSLESKRQTSGNVEDIRAALNDALEESRNANKINSLTQEILDISSQTNLLSLNASIEAARAGEA